MLHMRVSEIRGTFLGSDYTGILLFGGLFWEPPLFGIRQALLARSPREVLHSPRC